MTREEAIRLLDLNREYLKNTNNIGLKDDIEALNMAIKALEEKPFINKPCVSIEACKYDKNKVLDKIRAEIENYDNFIICANGQKGIHIDKALEIIDKYKAESEET